MIYQTQRTIRVTKQFTLPGIISVIHSPIDDNVKLITFGVGFHITRNESQNIGIPYMFDIYLSTVHMEIADILKSSKFSRKKITWMLRVSKTLAKYNVYICRLTMWFDMQMNSIFVTYLNVKLIIFSLKYWLYKSLKQSNK